MTDWAPGDVAVCISDEWPEDYGYLDDLTRVPVPFKVGSEYLVQGIDFNDEGIPCLVITGHPTAWGPPGSGWLSLMFRKRESLVEEDSVIMEDALVINSMTGRARVLQGG